ncbi:protein indeterminate-domain 7 [Quercus suber]|uniref:Protein indeterminate-domain 7 n=1 Tax=Quercus suber TaxID=58331 RepID=A0AAW0JYD2_QUESU
MMNDMLMAENMSNLTTASGEISASSSTRNENTGTLYSQQSSASTNLAPPPKRKRNLPGNPDPEAEVIALSPKSLMATNRFLCEICNKGFQRDQNLQLHRRGHNLPWKLKQRTSKEVRKKVYICPEPTCVHHDPSRALGDLTGIKKHFCRKHGEKKWKCEKCSKRYAVQSDWKAHSKICGTKEYRCDCGTLFSRRDSFITHRAFCDALAQESARAITTSANPLLSSQTPLHSHGIQAALQLKREQEVLNLPSEIPPWLTCPTPSAAGPAGPPSLNLSSSHLFSTNLDPPLVLHHENPTSNPKPNSTTLPPFHPTAASPHMSATALLQKAAQMGATMSQPSPSQSMLRPGHHHQAHMSDTHTGLSPTSITSSKAVSGLGLSSREEIGSGFAHSLVSFENKAAANTVPTGFMQQQQSPSLLHDMMSSSLPSSSGFEGSSFQEAFNGTGNNNHRGGNEGMTRDFLGLRAFSHKDFINMAAGFEQMNGNSSSRAYGQHNRNQAPWQG